MVVGGQAGSEAKGAATAVLANEDYAGGQPHVGVRVGGSQAGHTAYDADGREWPLRHVPVSFINPAAQLVIAAGSEIDLGVLADEVNALEEAGHDIESRLYVDAQATVIDQRHKDKEAELDLHKAIGSTAKGVGAARADRMLRGARLIRDCGPNEVPGTITSDTAGTLADFLAADHHVVIEGVQGFMLGLHAGHYPQCTTADTRAIDFLSMAGLSPWAGYVSGVRVVVVVRVYPIRVAGNSGFLASETTWAELGLPEELTTVTKKVRRVGDWNAEWVREAVLGNGGPCDGVVLALSMLDQKFPALRDARPSAFTDEARDFLDKIATEAGAAVALVGTGPNTMSVYDSSVWR